MLYSAGDQAALKEAKEKNRKKRRGSELDGLLPTKPRPLCLIPRLRSRKPRPFKKDSQEGGELTSKTRGSPTGPRKKKKQKGRKGDSRPKAMVRLPV